MESNPDKLFKEIISSGVFNNVDKVKSAYELAKTAHNNQKRKSGEDFILHPLNVASYLNDIGMDDVTVISALLHDVVEDTNIKISTIRKKFGKQVGTIVDGVTKLDKINFSSKEEAQAESIRKMVLAMSQDIRVLILKLADRLHNVNTLEYLPDWKQERIAAETLYVYAPLAHRLGLQQIKHSLENACLLYTSPSPRD